MANGSSVMLTRNCPGDHIINSADSSEASQITPVKTKKLFITGMLHLQIKF
jgi:hypothetical protein